jgi:C-terminal processing protease CtpA/Prc
MCRKRRSRETSSTATRNLCLPLAGRSHQVRISRIIGVKFEMVIGRPPTIKIVFSGTPASEEGVRSNDVIVAVDGIPTYGLSKEEVYDLIVGTPHTPVTLSLQRGQDFSVKKLMRMDFNDIPDPQVKADYLKSM